MFAVIGALAALEERRRSGRGQEVDVALYEAVAALMESTMADYELGGIVRGRSGGTLPGVAPANAYPTSDGTEVLIAGNADGVFARLCAVMGEPELAGDPRYATHTARGTNAMDLDGRIARWTATLEPDELLDRLADGGVPAGRVYTAPDMVTDPHYLAREMVLRVTSRAGFDLPITGIVPKFSRTPGTVRDVGPRLGEHTDEVAAEITAEIAAEVADLT
jgi:crotonobetainyl-CoA:carnitine CoA-transferase CaiB-like acyl-CoA transferase